MISQALMSRYVISMIAVVHIEMMRQKNRRETCVLWLRAHLANLGNDDGCLFMSCMRKEIWRRRDRVLVEVTSLWHGKRSSEVCVRAKMCG